MELCWGGGAQAGQAMACGLRAPAGTSLAASMPGCRAVIPLPTTLQLWGPKGSWFLQSIPFAFLTVQISPKFSSRWLLLWQRRLANSVREMT